MDEDLPFGDALSDEDADAMADGLMKVVMDYVMEQEMSGEFAGRVLLSAAISLRTGDYFSEAAKPSVSGLRLALDRFRKDLDESVREAKRHAEEMFEDFRRAAEEAARDGTP